MSRTHTPLASILDAVLSKKLCKPLLLVGPPGVGKAEMVRSAIQRHLCEMPPMVSNCGCAGCFKVRENCHPNVHHVASEKNTIGVDEIRGALDSNSEKLFDRIVTIENAHLMTIEASNALLKTLEESHNVAWVLMTPFPKRILPTIWSRCGVLCVPTQSNPQVVEAVRSGGIAEGLVPFYVDISKGSPGYALKMYSATAHLKRDSLLEMLSTPNDIPRILGIIDGWLDIPPDDLLWILDCTLRDVLSRGDTLPPKLLKRLSDLVPIAHHRGTQWALQLKAAFLGGLS